MDPGEDPPAQDGARPPPPPSRQPEPAVEVDDSASSAAQATGDDSASSAALGVGDDSASSAAHGAGDDRDSFGGSEIDEADSALGSDQPYGSLNPKPSQVLVREASDRPTVHP
jgi:hypothetical protein